jgi:hypothetical protein
MSINFMKKLGVGALVTLAPAPVLAQQMEPRAYSNVPIGINFALTGYAYSSGDVLTDPSLPAEGVNAKVHTLVAGYSRSLAIAGKSAQLTAIVPYARLSVDGLVDGQPASVSRSGIGDPLLRFALNLYGAPALSLAEFSGYRQKSIVGVSLAVSAPWGEYDASRLVNVGTNRWSFKPELGVSHTIGRLVLEGAVGATFFTDNDAYLGSRRREQDPLYAVQAHAVYNFRPGLWVALDYTFYSGGRTSVDGQQRNDGIRSSRWGATVALPVNRYNSIKLYASTGVVARTGTDFDLVGIAWQYRWGAGL